MMNAQRPIALVSLAAGLLLAAPSLRAQKRATPLDSATLAKIVKLGARIQQLLGRSTGHDARDRSKR